MGQGPSASLARGPSLGCGCLGPAMAPSPPPPPASTAGTEQDPGDSPQGGTPGPPPAAHRCSRFALSSAVCVLCGRADVNPDTFGRIFDQIWFWVHEFCLVSSLEQSSLFPGGCSPRSCPHEILLFSLLQIFANISFDKGPTEEGTVGIDLAVLARTVKQANQKVRT